MIIMAQPKGSEKNRYVAVDRRTILDRFNGVMMTVGIFDYDFRQEVIRSLREQQGLVSKIAESSFINRRNDSDDRNELLITEAGLRFIMYTQLKQCKPWRNSMKSDMTKQCVQLFSDSYKANTQRDPKFSDCYPRNKNFSLINTSNKYGYDPGMQNKAFDHFMRKILASCPDVWLDPLNYPEEEFDREMHSFATHAHFTPGPQLRHWYKKYGSIHIGDDIYHTIGIYTNKTEHHEIWCDYILRKLEASVETKGKGTLYHPIFMPSCMTLDEYDENDMRCCYVDHDDMVYFFDHKLCNVLYPYKMKLYNYLRLRILYILERENLLDGMDASKF